MSALTKNVQWIASSMLLCAVCCVLCAPCEAGNRIVAVVNEEIITEWDVHVRMSALLEDGEVPPADPEQASAFRQAVLDRLVEERLIIQEAKRLGLTVEPEEVAERVQALHREFAPKERFEQMLREAQLTEEKLKTKLREQLLMQRAIDGQVRATITVSPAELQQARASAPPAEASPSHDKEEVLAAHLLIRVSEERPVEEARQLIDQLAQRLLAGEAFESLARVYSEGPHAEEGGRLGWVKPEEMLPELAAALSTLPPGQISKPIQSALGFHLVKVLDRRQTSPEDSPDDQEAVHRRLYQQKFSGAMRAWLHTLKRGAYIQVMDE